MRAVLLCLLAVGCGKPAALPVEEGKAAPMPVGKSLPKPDGKIDAADLMHHYTRIGFDHKLDGHTIEVRISDDAWAAPDGKGNACVLFGSDNGFKRPALILRAARKWPAGEKPFAIGREARFHGRLVGLVEYQSLPEFGDWAGLTEARYTPAFDKVALIEDAVMLKD